MAPRKRQSQKKPGTVVVVVSDTHINSKTALGAPTINDDDGGTYTANQLQRSLWEPWNQYWDYVKSILKGRRMILVLNGDIIEGDIHFRSQQLISRNLNTMLDYAHEVLERPLQMAEGVYIIRGTPAHAGKSAALEEVLARDITNVIPDESRDTKSWWHLRTKIEGVKFDIAHHTSMGRLPWTRANAANKMAIKTRIQYHELGQDPPDLVIRSHNHKFAESGINFKTRAVLNPCWQYSNEFSYRIGMENDFPDIGATMYECLNGQYNFSARLYPYKQEENLWTHKT